MRENRNLYIIILSLFIFVMFYGWIRYLNFHRDKVSLHCEVLADLYALFCLLAVFKSKFEYNVAIQKYRTTVARFIRLWRRVKHQRCQYAQSLVSFAQRVSKDSAAGFEILMEYSGLLRPPFILKACIFMFILIAGVYTIPSKDVSFFILCFYWIPVNYILFDALHKRSYNLKKTCYKHIVRQGFEGSFLDIG